MPSDDKKPAASDAAPSPPPAHAGAIQEDDSLEQPASATPAADANAAAPAPNAKKPGLRSKIPFLNNMYLVIFIAMVLGAAFVVYISLKTVKPGTTTTKLGNLTDQQ